MGRSTWRSLNSVMLVTLHVALIASIFRSLGRPTTVAGSFGIWLPLSVLVGVFLSWPLGRAISAAFDPAPESEIGPCRECGAAELRPLLRPGAGLFQPVGGYRCARCGTTHRSVEGSILLERVASDPDDAEPAGIDFLVETPRPVDGEGIRFLDEDAGDPR